MYGIESFSAWWHWVMQAACSHAHVYKSLDTCAAAETTISDGTEEVGGSLCIRLTIALSSTDKENWKKSKTKEWRKVRTVVQPQNNSG